MNKGQSLIGVHQLEVRIGSVLPVYPYELVCFQDL